MKEGFFMIATTACLLLITFAIVELVWIVLHTAGIL